VLKKNIFRILFIGWMMCVTFSSLFSFSEGDIPKVSIPHFDKVVHFTFYFGAVVLGVLAMWEYKKGTTTLSKAIFLLIFFAIIFGIVIELIQLGYTSDRQGDVLDVLANTFGAICGGLVIKSYFSKKWALKWK